jgi:hypothetical protein
MKLILKTHSDNEHYNADCDYAMVELTASLAKLCLRRMVLLATAAKRDREAYELSFWDYHCTFFKYFEIPDEIYGESPFDVEEYLEVPDTFEVPEDAIQPTECDQMVVADGRVHWVVIPRHSSIYITTENIPLELIADVRKKALNWLERLFWRLGNAGF